LGKAYTYLSGMAGAAAKKNEARAQAYRALYTKVMTAIYAFYFIVHIYRWGDSIIWSSVVALFFFSAVNYYTFTAVLSNCELGVPLSLPQDILFVNWFVMATSVLSSWFWLVYLLVPAYMLYQYGGTIRALLCPPKEVAAPTEADQKRLAKKERQAGKVRYHT